MLKKRRQRIYAFIDSQNLNVSTQKFGWKMDWRKFRKFLKDKYGVTRAYLFIGYVPEMMEMYEFLYGLGYGVVLKPTVDMNRPKLPEAEKADKAEAVEKKPVKGNVDADMVLWTMKEMPNYDKAVIVTGDGDFFTLVEYLIEQKKLAKLLTPNIHYSSLFKPFDKDIEQLGKYRRQLSYKSHKSVSK
ncbi:TPA: hypothetical protein DIS56_02505 [Candidatus Saccharibacteria bacterium]|uniref:NYN domain-containing protein n=1 Tax=Candidatus Gottesmanbacteria bacterium RIFCSPHIGHO2_02_FULL_40_13 TaxID=1798384 RepID=A0A1F6A651_9BACT|nr:MAG: hypothetical protein A3D03_04340 [Candidatus Gottesmanbacteria bacterium RIFCSPHIGHO2_02_FULL_40_13]OGL34645.1 MAG: hypothetical protein A3F05_03715 [Candidatus Saccharibacteria bacterium RIFCSPHIGHO2_12_FULL_47_17]HCM51981.1 hypothetical protein [Candidatus Saccharibacteria bacterium]